MGWRAKESCFSSSENDLVIGPRQIVQARTILPRSGYPFFGGPGLALLYKAGLPCRRFPWDLSFSTTTGVDLTATAQVHVLSSAGVSEAGSFKLLARVVLLPSSKAVALIPRAPSSAILINAWLLHIPFTQCLFVGVQGFMRLYPRGGCSVPVSPGGGRAVAHGFVAVLLVLAGFRAFLLAACLELFCGSSEGDECHACAACWCLRFSYARNPGIPGSGFHGRNIDSIFRGLLAVSDYTG